MIKEIGNLIGSAFNLLGKILTLIFKGISYYFGLLAKIYGSNTKNSIRDKSMNERIRGYSTKENELI